MSGCKYTTVALIQTTTNLGPIVCGIAGGAAATLAVTVASHKIMKTTLENMCKKQLQKIGQICGGSPDGNGRLLETKVKLEQLQSEINALKPPVLKQLSKQDCESRQSAVEQSARTLHNGYLELRRLTAMIHGFAGKSERINRLRRRIEQLRDKFAASPADRDDTERINTLFNAIDSKLAQVDPETDSIKHLVYQLEMLLVRRSAESHDKKAAAPLRTMPKYLTDKYQRLINRPETGQSEKAGELIAAIERINSGNETVSEWNISKTAELLNLLEEQLEQTQQVNKENRSMLTDLSAAAEELEYYLSAGNLELSEEISRFLNELNSYTAALPDETRSPVQTAAALKKLEETKEMILQRCYRLQLDSAERQGIAGIIRDELSDQGLDPVTVEDGDNLSGFSVQEIRLSAQLRVRFAINNRREASWELIYQTADDEISDQELDQIEEEHRSWSEKLDNILENLHRQGIKTPLIKDIPLQKSCIIIDHTPPETANRSLNRIEQLSKRRQHH